VERRDNDDLYKIVLLEKKIRNILLQIIDENEEQLHMNLTIYC
jgi:hypothetical protein